mmetsp:Transcript_16186/g.63109  ORF Transcript_16186/g.63109 Transcript_16186/m.63109 type:complete len:578 (+) Transcript_16186:99-1832(+)|eukprot:CAMPEP_0114611766 /NCGR_PEP_ID=MMETSP0168-20121206/4284_1 /TAXON_ID=95228 ORGANISM="Vannella sp., Strain DIVA3 517/6/12" /NCGR_SAMPLE_ID=MMETSP0168 /ASSEMBLY_ACC=CAM_ASM_000044 /LENGTH=577 /DNA_ID=CAMNT_0001822747 /DNA_START=77 /DNA_END=1810 /DNA_ORIENTATION=-
MSRISAVLLVLAIAAVAQAVVPTGFSIQTDGNVNDGSIFTSAPIDLQGNPVNPVSIYIHFDTANYDANVCFNSGGPISGVNLASTCPFGGFAVLSNNTVGTAAAAKVNTERGIHEVKLMRKGTRFVGNERMVMEVEDESSTVEAVTTDVMGEVYIGPSGRLVVTVPQYNGTFSVTLQGQTCPFGTYPIENAGNVTCQALDNNIVDLTTSSTRNLTASISGFGSQYYVVMAPMANFLNISVSSAFEAYVMTGYVPTPDWSLPTPNDFDEDTDMRTYTVNTPGRTDSGDVIFVRLDNRYASPLAGAVDFALGSCPDDSDIGPGCYVSSTTTTNSTTAGSEVYILDGIVGSGVSNGTSVEFDLSEAEQEYAYFVLPPSNLPSNMNSSYYVRVSFANNVIDATGGQTVAPTVYAKLDGYPSQQSYDYRVNGSLVNQVIVPIANTTAGQDMAMAGAGTWYFAVETPSDFSVWAGTNCANLCDNNEHGNCYCNQQLCNTTTSNGQDVAVLYEMPNNIMDSGGACRCDDDNYDQSFDCSEKTNKNSTLYIVLIAVGGAIVLAVAIGVPVYCYFQNRKRARYDRV